MNFKYCCRSLIQLVTSIGHMVYMRTTCVAFHINLHEKLVTDSAKMSMYVLFRPQWESLESQQKRTTTEQRAHNFSRVPT